MPRPIQAHIDLSALEHNLQLARRNTSARIMAVIKANAYGHGLLRAASALNRATWPVCHTGHDGRQSSSEGSVRGASSRAPRPKVVPLLLGGSECEAGQAAAAVQS